jgi:hypothetical protein
VNNEDFEITVSDVSDVVATVRVRYRPATDAMVRLIGTLRGPYCERMRTLAAEFTFREVAGESGVAVAEVVDPCLWSPELRHVYQVEVEASCGGRKVADFHGSVGLQHTGSARS